MNVVAEHLKQPSQADRARITDLIRQMSPDAPDVPDEDFEYAQKDPRSWVVVLRDTDNNGLIIAHGIFTIATRFRRSPNGDFRTGWIEDFVVDNDHRGPQLGCADLLMDELLAIARQAGVEFVDLTTRDERVRASSFYLRRGFKPRDAKLYRLELKSEA